MERILLQNMTVAQLANKFAFYVTSKTKPRKRAHEDIKRETH
jgi:hypothetical protein